MTDCTRWASRSNPHRMSAASAASQIRGPGAPSNACQSPDRRKEVPGQDPCPLLAEHGGIWKFDENKLDQKQEDGVHFATGLRQMPAIAWHDGGLYIVMNSRDQLNVFWPALFTAQDNAERPAEPMFRADKAGVNFGWPYCSQVSAQV